MMTRRLVLLSTLSLAVAAALLAGCGEDDNAGAPAAAATPTRFAPTSTPVPTALSVSSDLAAAANGGGCYPTALVLSSPLDMLSLVDPEWAPIIDGTTVDSTPVLVHGTVLGSHGDTGGDFPGTHVRSDQNTFVHLDDADAGRLATGNDPNSGFIEIALEWEAGAYPDWAWGSAGDRVVAAGRWIFDCGHPNSQAGHCSVTTDVGCALDEECRPGKCPDCGTAETCVGAHFGYSSEIHPPYATAVMRSGRGAPLTTGGPPVPVTRTDVFISSFAGGAGDACILEHLTNPLKLLSRECYPLSHPVALAHSNEQDFAFDVPLPPQPAGGHAAWRVAPRPAPGGVAADAADIEVTPVEADPQPHLAVRVKMTETTANGLPTGYAGTLYAGWDNDHTPLTHVRVTVDGVVIHNALQPVTPVVPRLCSGTKTNCATTADCPNGGTCLGVGPVKSWRLQVAMNGEWQELSGLESVSTGDVIPESVVFDQYLPANGEVRLMANGTSEECIQKMFGKSLKQDLAELGFGDGLNCLTSAPRSVGDMTAVYPGSDFGAGTGSTAYETASVGGEGGLCSATTSRLCVVTADCPEGETCVTTGGAFALRYHIERLAQ